MIDAQTPATHLVYMSFRLCRSWLCEFLEEDLRTPLPRKLKFASADEVREVIERAGGFSNLESRQAFEDAIGSGRGCVYLKLSEGQYARLKQRGR